MYAQDSNTISGNLEYQIIPRMDFLQWTQKTVSTGYIGTMAKGTFQARLEFGDHDLVEVAAFEEDGLWGFSNFKTLGLNTAFRYRLSDHWSVEVGTNPTLASNFQESITQEDLIWQGNIRTSLDWSWNGNPYTFSFGIERGTKLGNPRFYPLVALTKKVEKEWGFTIGFPATNVLYRFNGNSTVSAFYQWNGWYVNNSGLTYDNNTIPYRNTKLSIRNEYLGLTYRNHFGGNFIGTVTLGYAQNHTWSMNVGETSVSYLGNRIGGAYFSFGLSLRINQIKKQ